MQIAAATSHAPYNRNNSRQDLANTAQTPDTLGSLLGSRPDLDLTGKVDIDTVSGIQGSAGGFSDVFVGYLLADDGTRVKVAAKKLRETITDNEKVCLEFRW